MADFKALIMCIGSIVPGNWVMKQYTEINTMGSYKKD